MTLILVLKFLSCQTPQTDSTSVQTLKQNPAPIGVTLAQSDFVKIYVGGAISINTKEHCYAEINKIRTTPVVEVDLLNSDYAILYEKIAYGYYIRLEKQGRLIKVARALAEYELAMAAAALARDNIPGSYTGDWLPGALPAKVKAQGAFGGVF